MIKKIKGKLYRKAVMSDIKTNATICSYDKRFNKLAHSFKITRIRDEKLYCKVHSYEKKQDDWSESYRKADFLDGDNSRFIDLVEVKE